MPISKGTRIGGRQKGTPNKSTADVAEKLARLGCDPIQGMAQIAAGKVPCGVCHGKGVTKFQPRQGNEPGERTCESCWGSKKEKISPELKGKMHAELAQYILPKRKALEVSGSLGTPDLAAVLRERFTKRSEGK